MIDDEKPKKRSPHSKTIKSDSAEEILVHYINYLI